MYTLPVMVEHQVELECHTKIYRNHKMNQRCCQSVVPMPTDSLYLYFEHCNEDRGNLQNKANSGKQQILLRYIVNNNLNYYYFTLDYYYYYQIPDNFGSSQRSYRNTLDLGNCKSYLLKNHTSDNNTRKKITTYIYLNLFKFNFLLLSCKHVQTFAHLSCLQYFALQFYNTILS